MISFLLAGVCVPESVSVPEYVKGVLIVTVFFGLPLLALVGVIALVRKAKEVFLRVKDNVCRVFIETSGVTQQALQLRYVEGVEALTYVLWNLGCFFAGTLLFFGLAVVVSIHAYRALVTFIESFIEKHRGNIWTAFLAVAFFSVYFVFEVVPPYEDPYGRYSFTYMHLHEMEAWIYWICGRILRWFTLSGL